jgi:hypothetical protein
MIVTPRIINPCQVFTKQASPPANEMSLLNQAKKYVLESMKVSTAKYLLLLTRKLATEEA